MSIKNRYFQSTKTAMEFLDDLAFNRTETFVFRGHANSEHRLVNTWQRERKIPHEAWMSDIDEALTKYKVCLQKLGLASFDHNARFEAMEYGRHHGVPTPCLDFSYSPFVALFFAFNGVRTQYGSKKKNYSVVYALNVQQLAANWAKMHMHVKDHHETFTSFICPDKSLFDSGFPADCLQFIPQPGSKNPRMQRQMGNFIYDTLNYKYRNMKDLEEFIGQMKESDVHTGTTVEPAEPTLYKIHINQTCTGNILQRLELMNMTGGYLYGDADGVAMDIKNTYNYNSKTFFLRDVDVPTPNDTI